MVTGTSGHTALICQTMNRRTLVARMAAALAAAPAFARAQAAAPAAVPWSARLVPAGFDGKGYDVGLAIRLDSGWKTYWRVPGAGGIAPEITVTGANLASFTVAMPLPQRLAVNGEEVIGYQHEVLLPLRIVPQTVAAPSTATVTAFFGVCDQVCIPAQFTATAVLAPVAAAAGNADADMVKGWQQRVPRRVEQGPVTTAQAVQDGSAVVLELAMPAPAQDVFVEGPDMLFFHQPEFSAGMARLRVSGVATAKELSGRQLLVTVATPDGGLEQAITVR